VKYIMALDQGTTSSRCIIFDHSGAMLASAQREFAQHYPKPGWVEHDAAEIWETTLEVARGAMAKAGLSAADIAAIGITNQRETTVVWDKETGAPVCPAIVWQCRRTAPMADALAASGWAEKIRQRTGLVPDAYFSGTKLRWILDKIPGARRGAEEGRLLFGTIDSWLIWNLTGGRAHVTDVTNASRTMLFDIRRLRWDPELLELFGIPEQMLPKVQPSSCIYGETEPALFGGKIPVAGAAGDQQSALFGQCCFEAGDVKNTYGTGCFLLMHTGSEPVFSKNGLITTIAASGPGRIRYALEGSVFTAGAAVQWLRDEMGLISDAAASEAAARSVTDTGGVYVVPAFTGLGAPYWNQYARGTITGITRGFTRAQLIRATLESIAYQTYDICRAMESDAGVELTRLRVDGGASANDLLMQFQSDLLGAEVLRPACIETTALGAAYLAGLAVGYWKDTADIRQNRQTGRVFLPEMRDATRAKLLKGWNRALTAALTWADMED
jgi:glycerol kinase